MQVWISRYCDGKRHIVVQDCGACVFDEWVDDWFANQLADAYSNIGIFVDREV